MLLYHGTSADYWNRIKREGLSHRPPNENWTVSDAAVYFWSPDKLVEFGEAERDYAKETAFQRAFESAQCALAVSRKNCRAVVIELDLPEDQFEIQLDESGDYSATSGAVCVYENVPPKYFKSIKVSQDLGLLRGYFVALMNGRDHFAGEFSDIEEKIAKAFKDAQIEIDAVEELAQPWSKAR